MYVERLTLNEFRAIAHSDIEFTHPLSPGADRKDLTNINLLVGTNGGGKSTVLKAIAAAALGELVDLEDLTGGAIEGWPRIGATGPCLARLTYRSPADLPGTGPTGTGLTGVSEGMLTIASSGTSYKRSGGTPESSQIDVFGYGPQRFVGDTFDRESASDPTSRVANLFEETGPFAPRAMGS